ncbi:MAG: 16S rRNA (cytosine(1402)-N(4))-methyltransferase RsmH [Bacilli bacterium]|nr:16S rRNA (cytosine(1402)-N(4))-methyltransferase RsmH [Bacilli bacterium]
MHISVLLQESIDYLNLSSDKKIVDCTLGYAGHSSEILKRVKNGFLFAFDQDKEAIEFSKSKLNAIASNYEIIYANFSHLKEELAKRNITGVDGVLYDLGVSSPQLDQADRGFSFHQDAKLDMRMNQEQKLSAYEVVNEYSEAKLSEIIYKYGEEKYAKSIAKGIVNSRPIKTTLELTEVVKESVPFAYRREKHPARKTFQAIRIEVNNELECFKKSLNDALDLLNIGGRICVITFHSLEDKICKEIFKSVSEVKPELKNMPIIPLEYQPKYKVVKTLEPTKEELENNPRARSAKLRVIERVW